ncbi:MAG: flagellar biosynthetic protein FliR [Desulfovibrionaceae bacterium]|nr:flagellar biosynthetic protein FliR [Desulfovibrionaceae bacterium]
MNIFNTDPALLFNFLLTVMRISIVLFMLPIFNTNNIPLQVKGAISLVLAMALWPGLSLPSEDLSLHPLSLALMIAGEFLIGLVLSLAINFTFMAIQSGGELLGFQMGFTMINFADPLTGNQTGSAAFFLWMVSLLVFLCLDGHLALIQGFAQSFKLIPAGHLLINQTILDQIIALSCQLFIIALKICAPVMVALFAIEVALGLVARTSPQMHIMDFGFPLKIGVGFFFLGMLLILISDHIHNFVPGITGLFENLLRAMSPLFAPK